MTDTKPDHERVLDVILGPVYWCDYEIASKVGAQHNSVHRAIHTLRHREPYVSQYEILKRWRHEEGRATVKEYRAVRRDDATAHEWRQVNAPCPACGSFYRRGGWCSRCKKKL